MSRSKVTAKFQVTIPRDVRDKVNIMPGETVSMEVVSQDEIVIRRYPNVVNPLEILIGTPVARQSVRIEKLEDMMEGRWIPLGKVYVDSNIFFYAKIMDKVFGGPCAGIVRGLASGRLQGLTSALVPIEVANALRKYGRAKDVAQELRAIHSLGIEILPIESTDVREAAEIYDEAGISPYDCVHVAVMKRNSVNEIVSADKEFEKVTWVKRLDPRSIT